MNRIVPLLLLQALACLAGAPQALAGDPPAPAEPQVPAAEPTPPSANWNIHFQTTVIPQWHWGFDAPYSGPNSLKPAFEDPTSFTATLFAGYRLWTNTYLFANPEESAGAGLSQTHGVAAFPNGEVYRVDTPDPKINLSRFFLQHDFDLGGEKERLEDDQNQFGDPKSVRRFTVVAGKFSLNDYFDGNAYSHDPRTQFFNWALMDNAAWDYAADTRGYTWGLYLEYHMAFWALKLAVVEVPASANGLDMDGDIVRANGDNAELDYGYRIGAHPGKIRLLGYLNHANMGNYRQAIEQASAAGVTPDVTATRSYSTKYGFGLNWEQEVTADLGLFSRLGWNNGATETWAFTEADRSFSLGSSLKGNRWGRPDDTWGLALIIDGLSKDHADYLSAGGVGFIIGDGPGGGVPVGGGPYLSYAPEYVLETYYSYAFWKVASLSADFQFVKNPAYNSDRGPAPIFAARLHIQL